MGLIDHLLHGPALATFRSYADPANMSSDVTIPPVPASSVPDDTQWPAMDFDGFAGGVASREYATRTVVSFIVRNIASLPFKVYRRNGDGDPEEVNEGPLYDLMKRPSALPGLSRYRFFQHLLEDMLYDDRWLCLLTIGVANRFTLRRIPSDSYQLTGNAFGEIGSVRINGHNVIKDMTISLPDPRVVLDVGYISALRFGDPTSNVLRPLLAESRAMMNYRANIAKNGAQIPTYVFRPKEMPWSTQQDYDEWVNGLRNYTQNGGMAGFMPTFKDGMEIHTVDNVFKPIDMNDLDARDKVNIDVANAFHISPENIGFRTGTNSNIAAYKEKLWNVELLPYIVAFEEALNLTIPDAVEQPDCYVKANLDSKLRGTLETQYQALSTATGRPFMETNRARRLLDMPKVPGGDEIITPLNVTVGDQPSPQDGGQTGNAQQGASPNGKTASALAMFNEFKRLHRYAACFQHEWDELKGQSDEI